MHPSYEEIFRVFGFEITGGMATAAGGLSGENPVVSVLAMATMEPVGTRRYRRLTLQTVNLTDSGLCRHRRSISPLPPRWSLEEI